MGNYVRVDLDNVRVGMEVDVREGTGGVDGVVTDPDDDGQIVIVSGTARYEHRFSRSEVTSGHYELFARVPYEARECIQYSAATCAGAVEVFTPGGHAQPRLRCEHHRKERARIFNVGLERYADSAVPPPGFSETYAGERWNEQD